MRESGNAKDATNKVRERGREGVTKWGSENRGMDKLENMGLPKGHDAWYACGLGLKQTISTIENPRPQAMKHTSKNTRALDSGYRVHGLGFWV